MGFLNPALLWFALGGMIPVIIHLLHRQKYQRVRWAAMEFLLAALRKTQRRLRLENLLLLLLRILIMILLALAVARPLFHAAPIDALGDTDVHHVFVVDTSYSMAYKAGPSSRLELAKKDAVELLEKIQAGELDRFSLLTLSSFPETPLTNRNRKEHLKLAIRELEPSHYGTSVRAAFLAVKHLLEDKNIRNRDQRIYLFTDLQRTGWELRDDQEAEDFAQLLKELSNRPNTKFYIIDVGAPDALNRAVVGVRTERGVVTTKRTARFKADLHNFSAVPLTSLGVSLHVDGALVETKTVVVPPNATIPAVFEYNFIETGEHIVRVSIEGDYLYVDDHRYLAVDVKSAIRGLLLDGDPKDSPFEGETGTLEVALDPEGQGRRFAVDVRVPELFSAEELEGYDFLVLANVQSLTADKVERIENFVRRGGGLFITLGARVDKVSFNRDFWKDGKGLSPAALSEVLGSAPGPGLERGVERRIARFAGPHPVFRIFRGKLAPMVYGMVFYKYYGLDRFDPERVLAAYDDASETPALLENKFGKGKVLLFNSTVDEEWNNRIVSLPPYLPLMQEICGYLATRPTERRNLFVGDLMLVDLPVEQYQQPFELETPLEGTVTLPVEPPGEGERFFRLFYPARARTKDPKRLDNEGLRHAGAYHLTRGARKEGEKRIASFAVNVAPREPSPLEIRAAEGNLERISEDEIRNRFPEFKVEFPGEKGEGRVEIDAGTREESDLWKFLLYLLLGIMAAETILAWLFGRAKQ
jgi:hypothetical protein